MSIISSWSRYCDDCGLVDSPHYGSAEFARRAPRTISAMTHRRLEDKKVYDICNNCDKARSTRSTVYDRRIPARPKARKR